MAEERISQGITTEKELELNLSTESHKPWITAIGKALSSAVRIDILNLIKVHPLSLQEISRRLGIPLSSTALHIRCLEDAHLVSTESQPGIHGSMRVCMIQISVRRKIHWYTRCLLEIIQIFRWNLPVAWPE